MRWSSRKRKPNPKYQQYLQENLNNEFYNIETAQIIGNIMTEYNMLIDGMNNKEKYSFIQTYNLNKVIRHFGDEGKKAVYKEMRQLHNRAVFEPIHIDEMTQKEK